MENIFSNKASKRMPQTLSDCVQPDPTVSNLHLWTERLENWGHILFCIIVVIGLLVSFYVASLAADEAYSDEKVIAFVFAFFLTALPWALCAFLEYCGYHATALLISALACITQSTMISANVALFSSQPEHDQAQSAEHTSPTPTPPPPIHKSSSFLKTDSWVCTSCGASNNHLSQSCTNCGNYR